MNYSLRNHRSPSQPESPGPSSLNSATIHRARPTQSASPQSSSLFSSTRHGSSVQAQDLSAWKPTSEPATPYHFRSLPVRSSIAALARTGSSPSPNPSSFSTLEPQFLTKSPFAVNSNSNGSAKNSGNNNSFNFNSGPRPSSPKASFSNRAPVPVPEDQIPTANMALKILRAQEKCRREGMLPSGFGALRATRNNPPHNMNQVQPQSPPGTQAATGTGHSFAPQGMLAANAAPTARLERLQFPAMASANHGLDLSAGHSSPSLFIKISPQEPFKAVHEQRTLNLSSPSSAPMEKITFHAASPPPASKFKMYQNMFSPGVPRGGLHQTQLRFQASIPRPASTGHIRQERPASFETSISRPASTGNPSLPLLNTGLKSQWAASLHHLPNIAHDQNILVPIKRGGYHSHHQGQLHPYQQPQQPQQSFQMSFENDSIASRLRSRRSSPSPSFSGGCPSPFERLRRTNSSTSIRMGPSLDVLSEEEDNYNEMNEVSQHPSRLQQSRLNSPQSYANQEHPKVINEVVNQMQMAKLDIQHSGSEPFTTTRQLRSQTSRLQEQNHSLQGSPSHLYQHSSISVHGSSASNKSTVHSLQVEEMEVDQNRNISAPQVPAAPVPARPGGSSSIIKNATFQWNTSAPPLQQTPPNGPTQAPFQLPQNANQVQKIDPATFKGLSYITIEDGYTDKLVEKLEENYLKYRNMVLARDNSLMTPYGFLKQLCNRMNMHIHEEQFNFRYGASNAQYRSEIYITGFCGVGHALSAGFARQLAAAHVLERLRIYFKFKQTPLYALYPGSRYTKVKGKLASLCQTYALGNVEYTVRINKRFGPFGETCPRFDCSCVVRHEETCVRSDNATYGTYLAAKNMYLNFVKPPSVPVVQIKDYFAIGAECPMLKEIHPSLLLNLPSANKIKWMQNNEVAFTDICLQERTNESSHLIRSLFYGGKKAIISRHDAITRKRELDEMKASILSAMEWIEQGTQNRIRRNNRYGFRQRAGPGAANPNAVEEADEQYASVEDGMVIDEDAF